MGDLFDAAAMYDEDYLYFFAAPRGLSELAVHGPVGANGHPQRPAHRINFVKRLFGFPELRDWLLAGGFTTVSVFGEDARPLAADHRRMVIVAGLP